MTAMDDVATTFENTACESPNEVNNCSTLCLGGVLALRNRSRQPNACALESARA